MDIAYAAHTRTCTFLLDSEGVCRDVVGIDGVSRHTVGLTAKKCIGAQYVASLDVASQGILVDMPRIGLPIVFARVDAHGRVSLVRTGVLVRLEPRRRSSASPVTVAATPPPPAAAFVPAAAPRSPSRLPLPPLVPSMVPSSRATQPPPTLTSSVADPFDDARTRKYQLPEPTDDWGHDRSPDSFAVSSGALTQRGSVSTVDPFERTELMERPFRTSDVVPTYLERASLIRDDAMYDHRSPESGDAPVTPYAIPLRRVK
jgi:hypothetical protein